MNFLLDTHTWIQRVLGEPLPATVEKVLEEAAILALADISLWEAAKLVELGRLEIDVSLEELPLRPFTRDPDPADHTRHCHQGVGVGGSRIPQGSG